MIRTQTTTIFTDPVPYTVTCFDYLRVCYFKYILYLYNIKIILYMHTRYLKNDIIYAIFEMIENIWKRITGKEWQDNNYNLLLKLGFWKRS